MSAQDDLLAAFGEYRPRKLSSESDEAASAPEETTATAEAGESETVAEAAATPEPAAATSEAQPEVDTRPESVAQQGEVPSAPPLGADTVVVERSEASDEELVAPSLAADTVVVERAEASGEGMAGLPASVPGDTAPFPPPQPYLDPAAFFAQLQAESAPPPAAKRRWPRLLLRYGSAVVLAGALGVGTAYAVTIPRRTDVPFLATPDDGRYVFPAMVKPAPPAGKPAPGASDNDSQTHYNDLRQYLVSAPIGLVPQDSWESVTDFDSSLTGTDVADGLADAGLRHIARRSWTALDGQHTVVELLQFPDHQAAFTLQGMLDTATLAKAGKARTVVPQLTVASFGDTTFAVPLRIFDQVDGLPGQTERRVVFGSGDVVAIVTTTAPARVSDVPTEQVVLLQAQMLR